MTKSHHIAFTGSPVADKARARVICEGVLDLNPALDCDRAAVLDPDGNTICIHKRNLATT